MATALLLRRSPDGRGDPAGSLRAEGETASAAAIRLATTLRDSYLPMHGPPGTGKTYTAAEQILELIAHGRTVGITGPSHAVIHRLIDKVYKHANGVSALEHILGDRATMPAAASRSWAPARACASSRCRARATRTPPRKRPGRWPGSRRS